MAAEQVKPLPSMLSNAPYEHLLPAVEQAALEAMQLQHTSAVQTGATSEPAKSPLSTTLGAIH